jgi:alpha-ribazole phosphatase
VSRWWWVRHGPTHQRALTGWRDVPADLSDTGALGRLNAALPGRALLVSSDLLRATATADCLAAGRDRLPPTPALREFHFGDWEGLEFAEVAARDPDLSRRYWEAPGDVAPPGGESWNDVAARVSAFVAVTNRLHEGRDIVAVAHIGVILTQLAAARGVTPSQAVDQHIAALSVTCIDLGATAKVLQINHQP